MRTDGGPASDRAHHGAGAPSAEHGGALVTNGGGGQGHIGHLLVPKNGERTRPPTMWRWTAEVLRSPETGGEAC
ncbi:hypothetical protein GCM10023317_69810 [Actinopolymorpha pittospori]